VRDHRVGTCFLQVSRTSPLCARLPTWARTFAAELNKAGTDLSDRTAVVFAEVGNRLVIGSQPTHKPHDLDIAQNLMLKPTARLELAKAFALSVTLWVIMWALFGT